VVGLSHKTAPVAILEQAAVSGDTLTKLLRDIALADSVAETFIVSTCNRVEIYADVDRFHAGVTAIFELLARHCGVPGRDLTPHLYVHYDERAVSHLLAVACGLDSAVVGEGQILGQVRSALKLAEEHGTVGRAWSAWPWSWPRRPWPTWPAPGPRPVAIRGWLGATYLS
jgi:glutamyl-tRNA reductase